MVSGAGALDRRIQFRRFTETDDGFSIVKNWANHGTPVAASKTDVSDGEKMRSGEVSASLTSRFEVRSSAFTRALTAKDALTYNGETFQIYGIKEIGRNRRLVITSGARVDD